MERKELRKRTILVTGAGGTIGREIIKILLKRRDEFRVRVFELPSPKNREFFSRYEGKLDVYYGDITNEQDLARVTKGVDFVYHLASVIPPVVNEKPELVDKVNVGGTRKLVAALEENSPSTFLSFASSVAVYGDRFLTPFIKVSDPVNPSPEDYYGAGKVKMEKIIKESRLQWTIFRLSAIMGSQNHTMTDIMFRMPLQQLFEICTPRDTARAFCGVPYHIEELAGRIFNLGGGPLCTTTYFDFLKKNFWMYGLGDFDFPPHAFATQNYHCGYYEDGEILDSILHFRRDTMESYYRQLSNSISFSQRLATKIMAPILKSYLLHLSKPYKAWKERDEERIDFFFQR